MQDERVTEHDLEAMAREHAPFLRRLAFALVGEDAAADDLVQETWLAAARARGEAVRSPRAWLAGTTRRLAAGWRRARAARPEAPLGGEPVGPAPEPAEVAEALDAERALLAALGDLEEPFRIAVWMRYREGLAPPEIAARLGVPLETVRSRLRRGLARLRKRLDGGAGARGRHALVLAPLIDGTPFRRSIAASAAVPPFVAAAVMKKLVPLVAVLALATLGFLSRDALLGRAETPERSRDGAELARLDAAPPEVDERIATLAEDGRARTEAAGTADAPDVPVDDGTWALTVTIVDEAGAPVPHHPVRVHGVRSGRLLFVPVPGTTDAAGKAVFEGLPDGVFRVEPDGCDRVPAGRPIRSDDGEDQSVTVTLWGAVPVRGLVTDVEGRPIAGAGLHSMWNRELGPLPVSVSDARGRLSARIGRRFSIVAPGFLRTGEMRLEDLPQDDDGVRSFEVALERAERTLAGLVVDAAGEPVPGALVSASESRPTERAGVVQSLESTAITDAEGRFRFAHGFAGERAHLVVLARGFAPSQLWLDADDVWDRQTIVLDGGRTIRALVRDEGGESMPDVRVEAQLGRWASLDWMSSAWSMSASTDERGEVVFEAVPSAAVTLQASVGGWGRGPLRRAAEVVEAEDAGDVELRLSASPYLRGRVVDRYGQPVPDLLVQAFTDAEGGGERVHLFGSTTDEDGAFEFSSLLGGGVAGRGTGLWNLRVRRRDDGATVLAVERDLLPDRDDVEVVVDLEQAEPGWIEGVVATSGGTEFPVGARPVARPEGGRGVVTGSIDAGSRSLRIGPLAPGDYFVSIDSTAGAVRRTGVTVAPGGTTDLGVLTLGGGPTLRLTPRLLTDADVPPGALEDLCASRDIVLSMGSGEPVTFTWIDGAWASMDALEPGLWRDTPRHDERLQIEPFEVRLEPGDERALEVGVHIGCRVPIEPIAPPAAGWTTIEVSVRQLGPDARWETRTPPRTRSQVESEPLEVSVPLLTACEVRAVTDTGLEGTARVEISELVKRGPAVRVELAPSGGR